MYNVHQHWDPLKVCLVGRSYPPEFYSFIKDSRVRAVMEKVAVETEEDYQLLINKLNEFGVTVLRPNIDSDFSQYFDGHRYIPPPMCPRDYSAMIGNTFYFGHGWASDVNWDIVKGADWPDVCPTSSEEFNKLPLHIQQEIHKFGLGRLIVDSTWKHILDNVSNQGNDIIYNTGVNTAGTSRIGLDLYHDTKYMLSIPELERDLVTRNKLFPNYRNHVINTGGHGDGTYCPVKPGLIISLMDVPTYAETFPGWEVIYLPGQSWAKVDDFLKLKEKNKGKWWIPGEEYNSEFTDFVESWLDKWVGYVEETVFDVNMLVIDEKNVLCNNYNQQVFDALERHGVTPHIVNFRHRYFWDGGLHCITSDLHREGTQKDYFPNRLDIK